MTPRMPLTSVGYAFRAHFADYVHGTGTFVNPIVSTVATGTAPLQVSSTTNVTNLNADMLDGQHATAFAPASHTHDDRYYDKAYVNALETRLSTLEAKLNGISRVIFGSCDNNGASLGGSNWYLYSAPHNESNRVSTLIALTNMTDLTKRPSCVITPNLYSTGRTDVGPFYSVHLLNQLGQPPQPTPYWLVNVLMWQGLSQPLFNGFDFVCVQD